MAGFDSEKKEMVRQAVISIIIILIFLVNSLLLYKIKRAAGGALVIPTCVRGPRFQTLISLVAGDIVVALFSLVVKAELSANEVFSIYETKKCKAWWLAEIYLRDIMSFTYGMGLCVLSIECMAFRRRVRAASSSRNLVTPSTPGAPVSLIVSAVPWTLTIAIALPVCIYHLKADKENCGYDDYLFAFEYIKIKPLVCQLLPAVIAVSLAVANKCAWKKPPLSADRDTQCISQQQEITELDQTNTSMQNIFTTTEFRGHTSGELTLSPNASMDHFPWPNQDWQSSQQTGQHASNHLSIQRQNTPLSNKISKTEKLKKPAAGATLPYDNRSQCSQREEHWNTLTSHEYSQSDRAEKHCGETSSSRGYSEFDRKDQADGNWDEFPSRGSSEFDRKDEADGNRDDFPSRNHLSTSNRKICSRLSHQVTSNSSSHQLGLVRTTPLKKRVHF
ncbi:hypothetical protein ElyMa_005488900 [Elysia marginata]|uniref:G-protein coupled receptors family 1 profile domain-containing protein n=1 Tax=Elysia marginata TaxID=1093978 RepID=A0AAV4ETG7_9GAST|nr:hypothetical protein ElyMa_005488900 [Elysia marginata]